ncbi:MAG TPA: lipid A deacylase LpxR family protein [Flavobacteriales bacterium]|nr:lipid A deacylase LpxR family protein [Flavobacteriales bacterium]
MFYRQCLATLPFLVSCLLNQAQTFSFSHYTKGYYAVNYSNDFFTGTDRYFTQGVRHDLVLLSMEKWKLRRILVGNKGKGQKTYGLSLDQDCFTPRTILSPKPLPGERPYSGTNFLSFFLVENNLLAQVRLTSKLDVGVTGPCVLCEQEQKFIHKSLNQALPIGWENQIGNGPVVNYTVRFEKGVLAQPLANFNVLAMARAGTLYTDFSLGFHLRFGKMNNYFSTFIPFNGRSIFQAYLYAKAAAKFVAFNATLQGRLVGNDAYVLPAPELERMVLQYEQGFAMVYKKLAIEFGITTVSPEFNRGLYHGWGNCRLLIGF